MGEYFSKPVWTAAETTGVAFGAIAASHGHWWIAVVLWLAAAASSAVRIFSE